MSNDIYCIFPMELVTNERYKHLSSNSKILYCLFLNRTKFSKKNHKQFSDEKGVFIYYTNSQIQEHLCCASKTATSLLRELEKAELIKKEYQQRGLPLKIYVKDIRGENNSTYSHSEKPQDKPFAKQYPDSNYKEKPVRWQNTPESREVSFDVERAERKAREHRVNFGYIKRNQRRTSNTDSTLY